MAAQHDHVAVLEPHRAHALRDALAAPADREQVHAVALVELLLRGGAADQRRIRA